MTSVLKSSAGIIQKPVKLANTIKSSTDMADKTSKVFINVIGAVKAFWELIAVSSNQLIPLTKLAGQLKVFTGLVGSFNLVSRIGEFVLPTKNGDYAWKLWKKSTELTKYSWMRHDWKPDNAKLTKEEKVEYSSYLKRNQFQDDGYWTPMKLGAQSLLTVAHGIEFVKFFDTIGLIFLGVAGGILGTIKNAIYIPASLLGISDSGYKIYKLHQFTKNTGNKVTKWDSLTADLKKNEAKQELRKKYNAKIAQMADKITALEVRKANEKTSAAEKVAIENYCLGREKKIEQWNAYLTDIDDASTKGEEIKGSLAATSAYKIKAWTGISVIAKSNEKIERRKNLLNIANCTGKTVFGIIGFIGLLLAIFVNPVFALVFSIGWAATELFGLLKEVYGVYHQSKVINKPHYTEIVTSAA